MKNFGRPATLLLLTLFLITAGSPEVHAEPFTPGSQWIHLTADEKFFCVLATIVVFDSFGVPFNKSPKHYIETIDRILVSNPSLQREDVTNILASAIYRYEPESRPALQMLNRAWK